MPHRSDTLQGQTRHVLGLRLTGTRQVRVRTARIPFGYSLGESNTCGEKDRSTIVNDHRDNVIWRSPTGYWKRAVYGPGHDEFVWTSRPCTSFHEAMDSCRGGDPGPPVIITEQTDRRVLELDHMYRRATDPNYHTRQARAEKRKIHAARNQRIDRIHEKITAQVDLSQLRPGVEVSVTAGGESGGMTCTGELYQDGDWLSIGTQWRPIKVYNPETGKLWRRGDLFIHAVKVIPRHPTIGDLYRGEESVRDAAG